MRSSRGVPLNSRPSFSGAWADVRLSCPCGEPWRNEMIFPMTDEDITHLAEGISDRIDFDNATARVVERAIGHIPGAPPEALDPWVEALRAQRPISGCAGLWCDSDYDDLRVTPSDEESEKIRA